MVVGIAMPVSAATTEEIIAYLLEKVKKGEGFTQPFNLPEGQEQIFWFGDYSVDIKAQLCFVGSRPPNLFVPCEKLKKAYPMIAPLITWVK